MFLQTIKYIIYNGNIYKYNENLFQLHYSLKNINVTNSSAEKIILKIRQSFLHCKVAIIFADIIGVIKRSVCYYNFFIVSN